MGGFREMQYPFPYKTGDGLVDAELDQANIGLIEILPIGNVGVIRTLDQAFGMEIDTQQTKYIKMDVGLSNTILEVTSSGVSIYSSLSVSGLITFTGSVIIGMNLTVGGISTITNAQTAILEYALTSGGQHANPTITSQLGAFVMDGNNHFSPYAGHQYSGMAVTGNLKVAGHSLVQKANYHPNWLYSLNYIGCVDTTGQYYTGPTVNSEQLDTTLNGGVSSFTIYGPPVGGENVLTIGPIANALTVFGTTAITGNINVVGAMDVAGDFSNQGVFDAINTSFTVECPGITLFTGDGISGTFTCLQPDAINLSSATIILSANDPVFSSLLIESLGTITLSCVLDMIINTARFTLNGLGDVTISSTNSLSINSNPLSALQIYHTGYGPVLPPGGYIYIWAQLGVDIQGPGSVIIRTTSTAGSITLKTPSNGFLLLNVATIQGGSDLVSFIASFSNTINLSATTSIVLTTPQFQAITPDFEILNTTSPVTITFGKANTSYNAGTLRFFEFTTNSPTNLIEIKVLGGASGLTIDGDGHVTIPIATISSLLVTNPANAVLITGLQTYTATSPSTFSLMELYASNIDNLFAPHAHISIGKDGSNYNSVQLDFFYLNNASHSNLGSLKIAGAPSGIQMDGDGIVTVPYITNLYSANVLDYLYITSTTALLFAVNATFSGGGDISLGNFLAPNLVASNVAEIFMGKALTTNNSAQIAFNYNSSGSATNFLELGLYGGYPAVTINGSKNLTCYGNITATTTGSQFFDLLIYSSSGSPPLIVVQTYVSTNLTLAAFVAPRLPTGYYNIIKIGVDSGLYNDSFVQFYYYASNSATNTIGIGITGTPGMYIDGNSALYVGGSIQTNSSADATSYNGLTGSIQTIGGISVKKSIFCGGTLSFGAPSQVVAGNSYIYYTTGSGLFGFIMNTDATAQFSVGGAQTPCLYYGALNTISGGYPSYNSVIVPLTSDATNASGKTGSLCTTGGVSIAQSLWVGTQIRIINPASGSDVDSMFIYASSLSTSHVNSMYIGRDSGTYNSGQISFYYNGSGSLGNYIELGIVGSYPGITVDGHSSLTVPGGITSVSPVRITDSSDATDATGTTGSLGTLGGVSIKQSLYVGFKTVLASTGSPCLAATMGVVTSGAIATFYASAQSASAASSLILGKNVSSFNALNLQFYYTASGSTSNAVFVGLNGASHWLTINGSGIAALDAAVDATTPDGLTGTVQVIGGISCQLSLWVGTRANIIDTVNSTDTELMHLFSSVIANGYATSVRFGRANTTNEAGNLYFRNVGTSTATNYVSLSTIGTTGITIDGNSKLTVGGATTSTGIVRILSTTAASDVSGTTGSLGTLGGASFAKAVYVNDAIRISNSGSGGADVAFFMAPSTAAVAVVSAYLGKDTSAPYLDCAQFAYVHLADNSASNYISVGIQGSFPGIKIDGSSNLAIPGTTTSTGVLRVPNTTNSSDATGNTGAIGTTGGVSVAKDLWVGANSYLGSSYPFTYSEGSWTPTFTPNSGTINIGSGTLTGRYLQIGSQIIVMFYFSGFTYYTTTALASLTITGLPFSCGTPTNASLGPNNAHQILASNGGGAIGYTCTISSTTIALYDINGVAFQSGGLATFYSGNFSYAAALTYLV